MERLQQIDESLFRSINQGWAHWFLDWLMTFVSGNSFYAPALALLAAYLIVKGGRRGRVMLVLMILILIVGDPGLANALKHHFARLRPFKALADVRLVAGVGETYGMPSGHATNWFGAATVAFIFYRRTIFFLLPFAVLVALSRIYLGVHYPGDVLVGAVLGTVNAVAGVWIANGLWTWISEKWFPAWHAAMPSLWRPELSLVPVNEEREPRPMPAEYWERLGYLLVTAMFLARIVYLALARIDLSEDEAYQWVWSKHLALSYYSKPPMIALTQWLGTHFFGDTAFGVRFFSSFISLFLSCLTLRFFARENLARAGFWIVIMLMAAPMPAAGSILMTVDPLSVLFWTAAIFSGWKAIHEEKTSAWCWTGLWMGLGFLSKYTAMFQVVSWLLLFALWPDARRQLRQPGFYIAMLIMLACATPVVVWNAQNGWPTVTHLAERAGLSEPWRLQPGWILDFIASEAGLLNPVFFIAGLWAGVAFWRIHRDNGLLLLFFCMGMPLFLGYFAYTLRTRVQPNWIAPAVIPLFCMAAIYWESRWMDGVTAVKRWLIAGLAIGLPVVVLLHETNLIRKMAGRPLPARFDPLRRVRAWSTAAELVGAEKLKLTREGKPVFVIGAHYGITGLLSFYMPDAKASIQEAPVVFYRTSDHPVNQFYFWQGYNPERRGQNALFVQELRSHEKMEPPPVFLAKEFEKVEDLGTRDVLYKGDVVHVLRLIACRNLR